MSLACADGEAMYFSQCCVIWNQNKTGTLPHNGCVLNQTHTRFFTILSKNMYYLIYCFRYILHVMTLNYYTQFNDIYTLTIKYIRVFLPELTQLKYI
jgi:hypothetical protein